MVVQNTRVSEYVLEAKIGGGTFGEVWRARHHVWSDQMVAIKIPTNRSYVKNLQREGRAVHGLEHPNIVRARGFDPYADPPYLVMEYIPGTSLRPLIQQKKLTPEQAVSILKQVLHGVAYAHKNNLVHRDIKPENILVHERSAKEGFNAEGVIKVTDFGLGKAATVAMNESIAYSMSMAGADANHVAGTLDYMSPEQRRGNDVDGRADLYACGVMFFEMLTGERPAGTDLPSALNDKVPSHLDDVFRRSYARLETRYASVEEFLKALDGPAPRPAAARPITASPRPGAPRLAAVPLPAPELRPAPGPGPGPARDGDTSREYVNSIGMKFMFIPPGTFDMGSPEGEEGRKDDEFQHMVTLTRPYYLGAYEVTLAQWEAVMGNHPSYREDGDRPVAQVTWDDTVEFCRKLSAKENRKYRLPTEAEWEYACRAGSVGAYSGTGRLDDMGWYRGNSGPRNHPVGQKRPNAWGLYDMHGNVWEWCADWYDADYYRKSPENDPPGPQQSSKNPAERVLRGGSRSFLPQICRSGFRWSHTPGSYSHGLGVRLVLDF